MMKEKSIKIMAIAGWGFNGRSSISITCKINAFYYESNTSV